jgi:hypothetical protein
MIGFNFHEGISYTIENIDRLSGNFRLTEPTYGIKSITYINERIRVTYESNHYRIVSAEFSRISPLRNQDMDVINPYVAQIVFFGGEYRDADDRVYTFGPSIVNWDGQPYEYTIQLDFIEFTPMDVIWIRKKGPDDPWKPYCFATNGNILDLYEYDYENKTVGKNLISLLRKLTTSR